jgi:diacylglycerol kinase family enzyme
LTKMPGDVGRIDVGRARRDDGIEKFFICNLGIGFSGAVTVESRRIGWLQGTALYGLAALRALASHFERPMFAIRFDDQPAWTTPTLMLAVLLGQREGGFALAPGAKLDDGLFDFVHVGPLSRWEVLRLLPRLALFGPPRERAGIRQGQCRSVKITSEAPVNVHVDGEFLCVKEDGMRTFEIDILPRALAVDIALSRRGGMPGDVAARL